MTDLDKLIAAVEAGEWPQPHIGIGGGGDPHGKINGVDARIFRHGRDAYHGSLDAALRLHEALLPGWDVDLELRPLGSTIESGLSDVLIYAPYSEASGIRGCHDSPARAWLLAILRAVKARGEGPG